MRTMRFGSGKWVEEEMVAAAGGLLEGSNSRCARLFWSCLGIMRGPWSRIMRGAFMRSWF